MPKRRIIESKRDPHKRRVRKVGRITLDGVQKTIYQDASTQRQKLAKKKNYAQQLQWLEEARAVIKKQWGSGKLKDLPEFQNLKPPKPRKKKSSKK